MTSLTDLYQKTFKKLEEDEMVQDVTANSSSDENTDTGVGVDDVLGKFDPTKGVMTPDDNYLPGGKKKKAKKSDTPENDDGLVDIPDDAPDIVKADLTKGK